MTLPTSGRMTPQTHETICRSLGRLELPERKLPIYRALREAGRKTDLDHIKDQIEIWDEWSREVRYLAREGDLFIHPTARAKMVQAYVSAIKSLNYAIMDVGHMYYKNEVPAGELEACSQLYWHLFLKYKRLEDYLTEGEGMYR